MPTHHGPKFSGAAQNAPISQNGGGTHGVCRRGREVGQQRGGGRSGGAKPWLVPSTTGQNGDADPAAEKSALPVHEEIRDQQPEKSS